MCKLPNYEEQVAMGLWKEKNAASRRDFLKSAATGVVGMALVPAWLRAMSETSALAADAKVVYVRVTQRAGNSMVQHFKALTGSGSEVTAAAHGINVSTSADGSYGAPLTGSVDGANRSFKSLLAAGGVPTGLKFVTYASAHNDDVGSYVNPLQLIAAYSDKTTKMALKAVGNPQSGGTDFASQGGFTPVQIASVGAYQGLVSPAVGPLAALSATQLGAIANLSGSISARHAARVMASQTANATQLTTGMASGYASTKTSFAGAANLPNPLTDARLTAAFNFAANEALTSDKAVMASLVKLVLDGKTRAIQYNASGNWDIHTLAGATVLTNTMNWFQGQIVPALKVLIDNGFTIALDYETDGSANWVAGNPQGDAGGQSMLFSAYYRPGETNPVTATQIGAYLTNGNVDQNANIISKSPLNCAGVRAANALKLFGVDPASVPALRDYASLTVTKA